MTIDDKMDRLCRRHNCTIKVTSTLVGGKLTHRVSLHVWRPIKKKALNYDLLAQTQSESLDTALEELLQR